jgi:uncharacterized C2H2 Zn-finger protein
MGEDRDGREIDWFGYPVPGVGNRTVACPRCDQAFSRSAALAQHLAAIHGVTFDRGGRSARLKHWWTSLGFLPLSVVLPLNLLLVAIVFSVVWPVSPLLAITAGALATFPLVLVLSHRVFRPPT